VEEAARTINDIINNGKIESENGDKVVIRKGNQLVTVRKNFRADGKKIADKNWVLTAYDETSADNGTSAIAATNQGQAAPATDVSAGKGRVKSANKQADGEKTADEESTGKCKIKQFF
jgi:hypothetical protein